MEKSENRYDMEALRKDVYKCLEEEYEELEQYYSSFPDGDKIVFFMEQLIEKIENSGLTEDECRIILESDNILELAVEARKDSPDASITSFMETVFDLAEEVLECDF